MDQIKLSDYEAFVETTVSQPSSNIGTLLGRLAELSDNTFGIEIPHLLTGYTGLLAEAGEFAEVVKKIVFQGKPLNEESIHHMKRELGDICWYLAVACKALDTDIDTVLKMNVEKLSARYPAGFEILRSEVRETHDI